MEDVKVSLSPDDGVGELRPALAHTHLQSSGTWIQQYQADRRLLADVVSGSVSLAQLTDAVPRLIDSRSRDLLSHVLSSRDASASAGLSYAYGYLAALDEDPSAVRWFTRAQAVVAPSDRSLIARIAFELGYLYLARNELAAADTVQAWAESILGESNENYADVLHLRALAAERIGDYHAARRLYRAVIASSGQSLTPMTRVLAMTNFAAALTSSAPTESLTLCDLALASIRAEELHPRLEPAVGNIRVYAMICLGEFRQARRFAQEALASAIALSNRRVELYLRFNLAVLSELEGDVETSRTLLEDLRQDAEHALKNDIAGWSVIRLAWLDLIDARPDVARQRLDRVASSVYSDAKAMLTAMQLFNDARYGQARSALSRVRKSAAARDDRVAEFAAYLWSMRVEDALGNTGAAKRLLRRALEFAIGARVRVSPNWWRSELRSIALRLVSDDQRAAAEALLQLPSPHLEPRTIPQVRLSRSGDVSVGDSRLADDYWREGRTGSRVLRRYFAVLLNAFPGAVERDELADVLWPSSDGDRALRNLYYATADLRRFLAHIPGVRLRRWNGRYSLDLDGNVICGGAEHGITSSALSDQAISLVRSRE